MPTIVIREDRCKGCERCIVACPQQIIQMSTRLNPRGFYFAKLADPPRCIGCRICAISCPDSAIEVYVEGATVAFFDY
jgi:2-oxoglutarate ferredoxin oxidoreductase subunit delta